MPSNQICVVFRHPSRRIRRRPLREFLADLTRLVAPGRAVTCLITTDQELRELNRKFRRRDYATDVLSFTGEPSFEPSLGEIAISLDRAAAQAAEYGHSIEEELRILILHAILHLTGMDHEADSGDMARAEAMWRRRLGLPLGLVERAGS
jgi:probable rRNA maturation factor